MLPGVCSVIDQRRRQNVVRISVTHSAIASCATFLFLPHFYVICVLLLNKRTATWNLFVKWIRAVKFWARNTDLCNERVQNYYFSRIVTHSQSFWNTLGSFLVKSAQKHAVEGNIIFPNEVFGLVIISISWIKIRVVRWKVSDQSFCNINNFLHFSSMMNCLAFL